MQFQAHILASSSTYFCYLAGAGEDVGPASRRRQGPRGVRLCVPYGSGTSAVTLPISSNSVFEVYSLIEMVP